MGANPTAGVPVLAAARAILGRVGMARPITSGRRAAIALLLATALLACHGFLGASHVLWHGAPPQAAAGLAPKVSPGSPAHGPPDGTLSGAHHAALVPGQEGQQAPSGPIAGAAEYFAVLLALAGAALLAAFFRSRRSDPTPGRLSLATRTVPRTLPLPRGPSPPLVRVFRL